MNNTTRDIGVEQDERVFARIEATKTAKASPLTIRIELRDQYGKQVVYPVCEVAKTFAAIAGTSTLTDVTLMRINSLGYNIITTQKEWKRP